VSTATGLQAAAVSMLRTLGGKRASLMVPQPAVQDGRSGLGLAAPAASEVELEPVLLRTQAPTAQANGALYALTTRCAVRRALELAQANGGDECAIKLTLERSMLRVNGTEYHVRAVTPRWSGGLDLLYELEIEA